MIVPCTCNLRCKTDSPTFRLMMMSSADSHGLCHRSRRDGDRSSKRKRHHAEHAEPAASQHVPAGPVPASDARLKLEAADEVVSPSKRVKKEPAAVVKASPVFVLIAMWHVQQQTVCGMFGAPCCPTPNEETTMPISIYGTPLYQFFWQDTASFELQYECWLCCWWQFPVLWQS